MNSITVAVVDSSISKEIYTLLDNYSKVEFSTGQRGSVSITCVKSNGFRKVSRVFNAPSMIEAVTTASNTKW